jgi:hypothetical protein
MCGRVAFFRPTPQPGLFTGYRPARRRLSTPILILSICPYY